MIIERRHIEFPDWDCEIAAKRLAQEVLPLEGQNQECAL